MRPLTKLYLVAEASVHNALYEDAAPSCYADAYRTREEAMNALRDLVDERIYKAFEGHDERDERTDAEVAEVFKKDTGEWVWNGCDCAYRWRILETEV